MRAMPKRVGLMAAGGLLVLALVLGGSTLLRKDDPPPVKDALEARSASRFLDSVGVNVHVTYYDTAYARFDEWSRRLVELGVRHFRDGLVPGDPEYVERMRRLGRMGRRATLIVDQSEGAAKDSIGLIAGPLRSVVKSVEAPNELDNRVPDWEAALRRFVPELRSEVKAQLDGAVPLLGPSFVNGDSRPRLDDISELWDIENLHPYPGGEAPAPLEPDELPARGERPMVATETGYHNAVAATEGQPPVSEAAAGIYAPRVLAENFASGIRRSFLYELIDEKPDPDDDDPEQHFGLLRQDLSPKPAYRAIGNLLRLVRSSPGEGPGRDVSVEGPGDLGSLLLGRADGSRCLLLWQRESVWDVDARRPVTTDRVPVRLKFAGTAREIAVDYPSREGEGASRPDTEQLTVPVGADLAVINFR